MRLGYRFGTLLVAFAVLMAASAAVATAKVRTVPAMKVQRGYATFKLKRVAPSAIRRASMRVGGHRQRLALPKVRRAAKRGSLRVRVALPGLSSRRAASAARRRKPKLVLTLSGDATPTTDAVATPTATTTDPGTTTTAPAKSTTRAVGSAPLSDAEAAARVRRSAFEPRTENATANGRVPSAEELSAYRAANAGTLSGLQYDKVTGNFRGTTDEIIQWAAWKWGFDEDVLRAVAAVESWWVQGFVGDAGKSFGLMQIKVTDYPGTHPLSSQSTAFNADYYGALMRYYYDGRASWLNDPCCLSATTYRAGDLWGSIGAHYSGRWYTASSVDYINKVKDYLARRIWEQPGF